MKNLYVKSIQNITIANISNLLFQRQIGLGVIINKTYLGVNRRVGRVATQPLYLILRGLDTIGLHGMLLMMLYRRMATV